MPTADVELQVTAVAAGGDGLGRLEDGRVVFVEGGLPGERVAVRLTEQRRDFARAVVVDVRQAAPDRQVEPCPEIARGCGGCPWQHVTVDGQRRLKVAIVADALRRLAHREDVAVSDAGPVVPATGYRTTARLAVDHEGRPSYRRRHGHDPVAVATCLVAHPLLEALMTRTRCPGAREVTLRVGARTGERLVWATPAGTVEAPVGAIVARRAKAWLHEEAGGRRWRISAGSFFQSGPAAAEALVAAVARAGATPGAGGHILDAYSGVGLLGGALAAARGARLTAIESHRLAAADAEVNLADLDARVVVAEVADVGRWGDGLGALDLVVADPSRPGLGPSAAAALAAVGAPVLVLVSCDPASLARDTTLLAAAGYRLSSVEMLDLFPHTFHVEAVSRFELA